MKKLKDFILENDSFGYNVTVSFNKRGGTYNTIIGGICSMVLWSLLLGYMILLISRVNN